MTGAGMDPGECAYRLGMTGFEWNKPYLLGAWIMGLAQIPFIINFFLEHQDGEKGERQSVGSDDARMDCAFAAAHGISSPRQLHIAARTNTACPVQRDYTMKK